MKTSNFGIQMLIVVITASFMTAIEYFLISHFIPKTELFFSLYFLAIKLFLNILIMYGVLSFVRWFLKNGNKVK